MPKKLCKQIQTCLRLFLAWRIPSRNNQTLTHYMIYHKKKESIIFLSAIHPNCQNRKYFNSPLSYLSTQYGGLVWVWMAEKKLIDSFSFQWIMWSVIVWLFLLGILQARKSLRWVWIFLHNFFGIIWPKIYSNSFFRLFHRNKPWRLFNTYQGFLWLFFDWQPWFACSECDG